MLNTLRSFSSISVTISSILEMIGYVREIDICTNLLCLLQGVLKIRIV